MGIRFLGYRVLGEAADWHLSNYALSFAELRHGWADLFNCARDFKSGGEGQRRFELIFAGDDQQIRKIQSRGVHSHEDLAIGWLRLIDLVDSEPSRSTPFVRANRFHTSAPSDLVHW